MSRIKQNLFHVISTSSLNESDKIVLYHIVEKTTLKNLIKFINREDIEPETKVGLKYGALAGAVLIPGGTETYLATRGLIALFKKVYHAHNYKCTAECTKDSGKDTGKYCYHKCNVDSCKEVIKEIELKLKLCDLPNRNKYICKKEYDKQLNFWRSKLVEAESELKIFKWQNKNYLKKPEENNG